MLDAFDTGPAPSRRLAALLRLCLAGAACPSLVIATSACLSPSSDLSDGGQSPPSSDGAVDAAETDAATDAAPPVDGPACQPANLSGFQEPPAVALAPRSTVCSGFGGDGGLVQGFSDACLGRAATYETCAAFAVPDAAGAADCYDCLVTPEPADAATYGVVVVATVPLVNYASCVLALDPTSAGAACAQVVNETAACSDYACKAACPVTDEASQSAYIACTNAASSGACTGYVVRAEACLATEIGDGGTPIATICLGGGGIPAPAFAHYVTMARYFCGAP